MPYDPAPRALREPDASDLPGLMQRTCQALQAMVASLEALDSVFLRLERLGPQADPPTALLTGTRDTVSRVVALLRREGPPLLFRVQALRLRLRGHAAGSAVAIRRLHADLDGLAAFHMDDAEHWGFIIRRIRTNTMILLAEFDGQRRRLTAPEPQPVPLLSRDVPALAAAAH